jgi:short-subunit dehydrogenase
MRAFARAAAEDLAERDVHSGCVCPGPVDTGFFGDIDTVPDVVFSQPMSSADQIADGVLECIRTRTPEIVIPRRSGRLATAAYLMPALAKRLQPSLQKRGKENKAAYVARKKRP